MTPGTGSGGDGNSGGYGSTAGDGNSGGYGNFGGTAGGYSAGGYGGAGAMTIAAAEIRRRFSPYRGATTEGAESWRYPAIRPSTTGLMRTLSVAPPRGVPGSAPETPAVASGSRPADARPTGKASAPAPTGRPSESGTTSAGVIAPHLAQAFEAFIAAGAPAPGASGASGASGGGGGPSAGTGGGGGAGSVVRRSPAGLFSRGQSAGVGGAVGLPAGVTGVIRRSQVVPSTNSDDASTTGSTVRESLTSREWEELVDEVVRRIEYRVADELARRGRRFTPPVY
jgi:hypothetical protein